jgi:phenylacetate-CoA ligase
VPWLLYEAAVSLGCAVLTVGDADATIQLAFLRQFRPNVIVTRSSRLGALAQAAREFGIALPDLGVERILTTGQLGSTDGATAARLREQWPSEYFDCYLLTEAGAVAGECTAHSGGMHLLERSVLAEVVHPDTGERVAEGEPGELVLTTLRRHPQPLVRYRTGDLVRLRRHDCPCGLSGPLIFGGLRRRET